MPPRRKRTPASPPKKLERLTPGSVAEAAFCLDPDRDERASQLCAEMLLTLSQNGYAAPVAPDALKSPKRQRFAIRSLALGWNFLSGRDSGSAGGGATPEHYGALLAAGSQLRGSTNLDVAQKAMLGLVDPDTQRGQRGVWLLRPFHESLLWYDARTEGRATRKYSVRKVQMRGSGITLARILTQPAERDSAALGAAAVDAIRKALTAHSPFAAISKRLESALPAGETWTAPPRLEDDEQASWERGADPRLQPLTRHLCRHAEGVMGQAGSSGPACLWQLRSVVALDLALHVLRTAWDITDTPPADRYLLLGFGGVPRREDPVRQRSEESFRRAKIRISEAMVLTFARRMRELKELERVVDWPAEFQKRSPLGSAADDSVSSQLARLRRPSEEDYMRIARVGVESANYSRGAEDGFRVLLESVGLLAGTGAYRYLTASPDLLAAMVGALSARMPMSSREFFAAAWEEWGVVVNQESAAKTALAVQLDGTGLERNARMAERLMSEAGLAVGLSDRTTVVGERAARTPA